MSKKGEWCGGFNSVSIGEDRVKTGNIHILPPNLYKYALLSTNYKGLKKYTGEYIIANNDLERDVGAFFVSLVDADLSNKKFVRSFDDALRAAGLNDSVMMVVVD